MTSCEINKCILENSVGLFLKEKSVLVLIFYIGMIFMQSATAYSYFLQLCQKAIKFSYSKRIYYFIRVLLLQKGSST